MNERKEVETIKMVSRALDVLDVLRTSKTRLGVNEIAKFCEMNTSTAYRILKTLEQKGWAYQSQDDRYMAGEKISFVTEKDNLFLALKEAASFIMEKYTLAHGRAMNLLVRDGADCVVLQQSRTKSIVDYVPPLGAKLPFYACAGGKILLSELPPRMIDSLLEGCVMEPLTRYTIVDADKYLDELRKVTKQGYAFDDRESSESGSCISVPVRDKNGTIIAALSFSGFVNVENVEDLQVYLPFLRAASKEITDTLFCCFTDTPTA